MTAGSHPPGRPATILDVAAAAGVSRQTVTRATNDMPGISAATKARVLAAVAALGYRPSRFGRGLVKGEHRTLGLVVDDLANPYYPELASAVVGLAAEAGWNVVLADVVHANDPRALVSGLARQVDALIGHVRGPDDADVLPADLPVVQIDVHPTGPPRRAGVHLDLRPGITAAVDHLVGVGVRRLVMLDASPVGRPSGRARLVVAEMDRHGLPVEVVATGDATVAAGARGMTERLAGGDAFDAVLAFNDAVALGALQALRRSRVDVPETVRVLGVDGLTLGTYVTPQLSTLALDMAEVARHAVELAVGMAAGRLPWSGPSVQRWVAHRLVLRESA